jgi:uncharacterized membrane protein
MEQNTRLPYIITLSLIVLFFIGYFNHQTEFPLWQFYLIIGFILLIVFGIIVINKLNQIKNLLEKQVQQNDKIISLKK